MEENQYRETYNDVNALPCVFERAMLARCCGCEHARRLYLAEREAVGCHSTDAHVDCAALLDLLHRNARFVLRQAHTGAPLPHAKEMRVQCGGLRGLVATIEHKGTEQTAIDNVHALVRRARERFDGLRNLPMQTIVQSIARFQTRRRGHRSQG